MPKKIKKAMNSSPSSWPSSKRGKQRALKKPANATKKKFVKVKYVRHGTPTVKNTLDKQKWHRSVQELANMEEESLLALLEKDNIIQKWKGKSCPHCGQGVFGARYFDSCKQASVYRCNKKSCMRRISPHDFHPIFICGRGHTPLGKQAALLLCAAAGVPSVSAHLILDVDDKVVNTIYTNYDIARSQFVMEREKTITYGQWHDVEADEVDLGKGEDQNASSAVKKVQWEQWGGLVERGRPDSLMLFRLKPALTHKRAPGPGAIRKRDWAPIARKHLHNKQVILHTDGARAYKDEDPQCHPL